MARVDLEQLEIYPLGFYATTAALSVQGAIVGPIAGPFVVRWFTYALTTTNSVPFHSEHYRVDFSPVSGLDPFVYTDGQAPSGRSSAPYTLFPWAVDFDDSFNEVNVSRPGWLSAGVYSARFNEGLGNLAVMIPLESAFVKVYWSNGSSLTEAFNVRLGVSPLAHRLSAALSVEVPAAWTVERGGGSAPGGGVSGSGQAGECSTWNITTCD